MRTATKKRLEKNRELAQRDARNRCACCRKAIEPRTQRVVVIGADHEAVYCSVACSEEKTR